MGNIHLDRIEALRGLMSKNGWDAVVIGGSDPHSSEYPALRWKQVEWLSGFTGEAGDLVITMDHAGLWTDSRYFIQALTQLEGTGVELHKTRQPDSVYIPQWLPGRAKVVAFDGLCQSVSAVEAIKENLAAAGDYQVVDVPDLLSQLWEDRLALPVSPITTLDVESFGGITRIDKIEWISKWMMKKGLDQILVTSLDEIAWMLNVRGNDIEYNPLVMSYLFITQDYVKWFVKKPFEGELDQDTIDSFDEIRSEGVEIEDYDAIFYALAPQDDSKIFIDPSTTNYHLYTLVQDTYPQGSVVCGKSPIGLEKALKVDSEVASFRQTYIEDGVAVEKFIYWLEKELESGRQVDEWEASEKMTALRAEILGYRGNSFENISAYGPNAALPHYSTPPHGSAVIQPRGLFLLDSGGQYLTGTTDITRTIPTGECTDMEKEDYTLVLRGMIGLSMAVFPKGTTGCHLDILARNAMWQAKRNFGHGTGHGIGFYLCVHEGPQEFRQNFTTQPFLPGMVNTVEPGIYREGQYGIRHENTFVCREAGKNEFGEWLEFETLTRCHFDTTPIVKDLLTKDEIAWLNDYNETVYQTLSPLLEPEIAQWLRNKTLPI